MYCLDTNIAIDIFHGDTALKNRLAAIINNKVPIGITPISLCELYRGAFLSKNPAEAVALIEQLLKSTSVLDFIDSACIEYGKLYAVLLRKGKPTEDADLMIGAIAKAHDNVLVTRNRKDFEHIPGLKIEVW